MKHPISTTGWGARRHSQSGSPTNASIASAITTTKSVVLQSSMSAGHALEFGGQPVQCLGQQWSPAHGQFFRDYEALGGGIKALQRRMQQESAAEVFGKVTAVGHQEKIRPQADDRFQRCKSAELEAKIDRCVAEAR